MFDLSAPSKCGLMMLAIMLGYTNIETLKHVTSLLWSYLEAAILRFMHFLEGAGYLECGKWGTRVRVHKCRNWVQRFWCAKMRFGFRDFGHIYCMNQHV